MTTGTGTTRLQAGQRLDRVFLLVAAAILGDTALYGLLPVYAWERGISLVWVGIILSANRLVRLATNPVAAWLLHRAGAPIVFPAAMVIAAVTTATYGLTSQVVVLLVARLLWGFTWSVARLTGYDMVAGLAPAARRGWWMGRFRSTFRLGSLIASGAAGLMADVWGYSLPFLLFAAISGAGAVIAFLLRDRLFNHEAAMPTASDDKKPGPAGTRPSSWPVWGLGTIVAWVAEGLVPSTLGYLVVMRLGESVSIMGLAAGAATFTGFLLSFRWCCDLVIAPVTGKISDRWGVKPAATVTLLATAAFLPVLLGAAGALSFALAAMVLLAGLSAAITLSEVVAVRTAPGSQRTVHLSRYATAADAGSAMGPLGGYALGAGIGIAPVYTLAALLLAGSIALVHRTSAGQR